MNGTDLFIWVLILGWAIARSRLHQWQLRKRERR